jgi:hypothetical protein
MHVRRLKRLCRRLRNCADDQVNGVMIMADGQMARLFWRVVDELDYRVMQARFWLRDVLCGPESGLMPDEWRKFD